MLYEKQRYFEDHKQRARVAIGYGAAFLKETNLLGEQLLNKIEEVRWEVNDAVRRTEPDLLVLDSNLRSIVSSRLAFSNVSITKNAADPVQSGGEPSKSGPDDVRAIWGTADDKAIAINTDLKELHAALSNLSAKTVLRFPENTFAKCGSGDLSSLSAPTAITLDPATITVSQGYAGGTISTEIKGGREPFSASNDLTGPKPEVSGRVVQVHISKDEANPKAPIQTLIKDLYGHAAIFSIVIPKAPEAGAGSGGGENQSVVQSVGWVKSDEVKAIQMALFKAEDATGKEGGWLAALAASDPSAIAGLNAETATEAKFVDGELGPVTRRVLQKYLIEEVSDAVTNRIDSTSTGLPGGCPAAVGGVKGKEDFNNKLESVYPDGKSGAADVLPIDKPLIDFIMKCNVL